MQQEAYDKGIWLSIKKEVDRIGAILTTTTGALSAVVKLLAEITALPDAARQWMDLVWAVCMAITIFLSAYFIFRNRWMRKQIRMLEDHKQFIAQLLRRGHLHTARMMTTMADNQERRDEYEKIQKYLTVADAHFSFRIAPQEEVGDENGKYSVIYQHDFQINATKAEDVPFVFYLFGDESCTPQNCVVKIKDDEYKPRPYPVEESFSDTPSNNGVYCLRFTGRISEGLNSLTLRYDRCNAYDIQQDEQFMICPDAFLPGIKRMSVTFDPGVMGREIGDTPIKEISRNGGTSVWGTFPESQNGSYTTQENKVDGERVYILDIQGKSASRQKRRDSEFAAV